MTSTAVVVVQCHDLFRLGLHQTFLTTPSMRGTLQCNTAQAGVDGRHSASTSMAWQACHNRVATGLLGCSTSNLTFTRTNQSATMLWVHITSEFMYAMNFSNQEPHSCIQQCPCYQHTTLKTLHFCKLQNSTILQCKLLTGPWLNNTTKSTTYAQPPHIPQSMHLGAAATAKGHNESPAWIAQQALPQDCPSKTEFQGRKAHSHQSHP